MGLIHDVLRRNLGRIIQVAETKEQVSTQDFADFIELYLRFLMLHHEGEDQYIFPVLKKGPAVSASDAAFLDSRGSEHVQVHATCEALGKAAREVREQGSAAFPSLGRVAGELRTLLLPHLQIEEQVLTASHMAKVVSASELEDSQKRMVARDQKEGGTQVLLFIIHALTPDEQRAFFLDDMPWFVRKVLVGLIWSRSYRRFLPFSHSRTIGL
ncbi:MAG: hemerythrin domain-containing protein [Hyalangium sp.]